MASIVNNLDMMRYLVDRVNCEKPADAVKGFTALQAAARPHNMGTIRYRIDDLKADINAALAIGRRSNYIGGSSQI